MKVISYSLFGVPDSFEFGFYLRGVYFNARMSRILMPEFKVWIYTTEALYAKYYDLFSGLMKTFPHVTVKAENNNPQRCLGMLWRMKPLFESNVELVFCRDADSVITYREACCNLYFESTPMNFHAINDNDAHGGLMGGLVAFRSKPFRDVTKYSSFNQMVSGLDLRKHGSDQDFLNKTIHPKIRNGLLLHQLKGAGISAPRIEFAPGPWKPLPQKYWTADLISRYIGSAGVIDFELLRWFNSHDNGSAIDKFEKQFPQIFYWQNK